VKDMKPDAAILTEPSGGQISLAHRAFAWITLRTKGKAAHGSLYTTGIDAIRHMGKLLGELDRLEREVFPRRSHPLLGRPSTHASLIEGGNGLSTYPDAAKLVVEHRPLPDEGPEYLLGLWNDAIKRFAAQDPTFLAEAHLDLYQGGWEVTKDSPIVVTLAGAFKDVLGEEPMYRGQFGWLDASIMHAAGIPVVVYGPVGDGDHAAVEYVDLESVQKCAAVIAETVARWSGQ
jgi:acetylornithine deacetylase/succinyl-diaminopimelate desuccinylase-like protein